MNVYILILLLNLTFMSTYNVGDIISTGHQNQEFELCYGAPGNSDGNIKFSDYNGSINGGDYSIMIIDMSATWCGPCVSLIPLFDDLQQQYINNTFVKFFVALSDLDQPYSCTQWGNMGDSGIPFIINDTGYPIFNMFNTGSSFPSLVFIDHEMKVYYKDAGYSSTFIQDKSPIIDEMLYNLENSLILSTEMNQNIINSSSDGDNLINPGEEIQIEFIISNNSFYLDALSITANIQDNIDIDFEFNTLNFNNIDVDASSSYNLLASVSNDVFIGVHDFILSIQANYIDLDGNFNEYFTEFPFSIEVTLSQEGFPFDTNSEIKSSPVVIDFDNDGDKEVIFGDYTGMIHIVDTYGMELDNEIFPFDTGNQIWGSIASGDIDNDGFIDIAVLSKSKHLYIFDYMGLKLDYNANQYLIGTPALGNLDDDDDLEIVFGSYSSSAKLFAINIDGSNVNGFPLELDEKTQKGVALADFNNNGKDDIVIGTDDDNIYLIYDNAQIAPGFPLLTQDKVRSAPAILDNGNEKIILAGSKDNHMYGINSNGSLRFSFEADDEIYTSPSFLEISSGLRIFFGTESGSIYALDINGNLQDGFPFSLNNQGIVGSIVFEDIDSDGLAELIFGDKGGKLHILKTENDNYTSFINYDSFPISNVFAYSSSANIEDIDNDGDFEIYAGTTGDVIVIDIKQEIINSNSYSYWNIYRGNYLRNGLFITESQCSQGDINIDGIINILDIVSLVNIVINNTNLSDEEFCTSDINSDGIINILDIVLIVNWVISEN